MDVEYSKNFEEIKVSEIKQFNKSEINSDYLFSLIKLEEKLGKELTQKDMEEHLIRTTHLETFHENDYKLDNSETIVNIINNILKSDESLKNINATICKRLVSKISSSSSATYMVMLDSDNFLEGLHVTISKHTLTHVTINIPRGWNIKIFFKSKNVSEYEQYINSASDSRLSFFKKSDNNFILELKYRLNREHKTLRVSFNSLDNLINYIYTNIITNSQQHIKGMYKKIVIEDILKIIYNLLNLIHVNKVSIFEHIVAKGKKQITKRNSKPIGKKRTRTKPKHKSRNKRSPHKPKKQRTRAKPKK